MSELAMLREVAASDTLDWEYIRHQVKYYQEHKEEILLRDSWALTFSFDRSVLLLAIYECEL